MQQALQKIRPPHFICESALGKEIMIQNVTATRVSIVTVRSELLNEVDSSSASEGVVSLT